VALPVPVAVGAALSGLGTGIWPPPVTLIAPAVGNGVPESEAQTEIMFVSSVTAPVSAITLPDTLTPVVTVTLASARMCPASSV
jgi:hypothetical protein